MPRLLDLGYACAAIITAPFWMARMLRRNGLRSTDWPGRFGRTAVIGQPSRDRERRRLLIHAVSVGEINAIRLLVDQLAADGALDIIISVTTDTGFARATSLFSSRHTVVRYPLDFSFAVNRFLDTVQPDAVALVELEVWPNFVAQCGKRDVPVCIINGRLTDRSMKRYRIVRSALRSSFRSLHTVAVQNEPYAQRFAALGVPEDRIIITGTMKWDTAQIADNVPGADALADAMGIDRSKPLVVGGSTAVGPPDEHELLVRAVPEGVQLLCAPRRPEWFDSAARAMPGCVRRSSGERGSSTGRFLLDTFGELRQAYALADVVVVGRSFGDLHGSDMMEPIALGKATIVGPAVSDFQDTAEALIAGGGLIQTDAGGLASVLRVLLDDPARRMLLAERGRAVIRANQGASTRHADMLREVLQTRPKAAKTTVTA